MSDDRSLIDAIDDLLPQTQCQLCEYDGCRPYATAIATQHERIDRCLPGGVDTLRALGDLLSQDPEPYIAEMEKKARPNQVAIIREAECIGCTKCIQACPVDAIIGASKQMHTIIANACTGCELCIEPCPVDCIDLKPIEIDQTIDPKERADWLRDRYQKHQTRLDSQQKKNALRHQANKLTKQTRQDTVSARQAAIAAAITRRQAKKSNQGNPS